MGAFELGSLAVAIVLPTAIEVATVATATVAAYYIQNSGLSDSAANGLFGVLGYMLNQTQTEVAEEVPQN